MTLDPAAVHRRSIALVRHYRSAEMDAVGALLGEISEMDDAGATIAALVQLASWALDERPADADKWLDSASLAVDRAAQQP